MEEDIIVAKGLVKRFKNKTAVDGVDLTLKKGEIFGPVRPLP